MVGKGKDKDRVQEGTESTERENDEGVQKRYLTQLKKVSGVVSVGKESIESWMMSMESDSEGEIRSEFKNIPGSDNYIEELGKVDDIGQLDDIGQVDDIQLNHNDREAGKHIQLNQNVGDTGDFMLNLNVGETGEADCDDVGRDDDDKCDSDDDSYMEHSESECFDSEESLEDDYEIDEDSEDRASDEDEGNLGFNYVIWPLQERVSQGELEGSETRASFTVGMTLLDRGELRRAIDKYAIEKGVNVKIVRSEKKMVIATCQEGCPFRLYAARESVGPGYMVKTLVHEHMCARVYKNQRASERWLAEYFKDKVQDNPQFSVTEMKKEVERELKLFVSRYKCKRAKRIIMEVMEGGFVDDFAKLEAYCNELKQSNPGSDVSVELSGEALEQGRRVF